MAVIILSIDGHMHGSMTNSDASTMQKIFFNNSLNRELLWLCSFEFWVLKSSSANQVVGEHIFFWAVPLNWNFCDFITIRKLNSNEAKYQYQQRNV